MPTEDDLVLAIKQCPPGETGGLLAEYYEIVDARIGGTSALLYACYLGRPDVAAAIGRNRRSIDVFEAAALGDTARLAAVLNDNAASVDAVAGDGFHPLGLACFFGQLEAVILLLARGADVAKPAENSSLVTPLHSAVAAGRADIAALLLDHGAPVDARQQGGFTALMSAALRGDDALVDLLLAHGAALDPIDDTGKSAADHAEQGGHPALALRLTTGPARGDDAGEDDHAAHDLEDPEPLA
jgi:ankyrin repeat protein